MRALVYGEVVVLLSLSWKVVLVVGCHRYLRLPVGRVVKTLEFVALIAFKKQISVVVIIT